MNRKKKQVEEFQIRELYQEIQASRPDTFLAETLHRRLAKKKPILQRGSPEQYKKDAKIFEIEMLDQEIFDLKGVERKKALKTYHKILKSLDPEPIYLVRT